MKERVLRVLVLTVAVGGLAGLYWPVSASIQGHAVSKVWAREDDYWRFVEAGDVDSYRTLWHEKFIGWPCDQDHPVRKSSIGEWVREIRDKKIKVDSHLTREGAEVFGDIVVVHYRFTRVDTHPDGRVEGVGRESKITHSWMKVAGSWQIIGGMCGSLTQAPD